MMLTAKEMEWARQLAAQQAKLLRLESDPYGSMRDRHAARTQCEGHIARLKQLLLSAAEEAAMNDDLEIQRDLLRFDDIYFDCPLLLHFTDTDKDRPSYGGSFIVDLRKELAAFRATFTAPTPEMLIPEPAYDVCAGCGDQTTFHADAEHSLCPHCAKPPLS
jgi:hypothetical protein